MIDGYWNALIPHMWEIGFIINIFVTIWKLYWYVPFSSNNDIKIAKQTHILISSPEKQRKIIYQRLKNKLFTYTCHWQHITILHRWSSRRNDLEVFRTSTTKTQIRIFKKHKCRLQILNLNEILCNLSLIHTN